MLDKTFDQDVVRLIDAVLSLKNSEECKLYFEDLLTIQELHSIAQRLKVATMLSDGMTCHNIAIETGASTATISRVNKCLNYGTGGYKIILDRIKKGE